MSQLRRLAASFLLAGAAGFAAHAAPHAEFPELAFDAGQVRVGTDIEHDFVIKNTGDEPLLITGVHTTCGCTIVDYDKSIAPGATGKVKARIKTKELGTGRQSKTLTVNTNAPNAERTVLQVRLDHVPPVEIGLRNSGGRLYLVQRKGETKEEKVLVRPHLPGMKITGATSNNPSVLVSIEPARPSEKQGSGLASMLLPREGDVWVSVRLRPDAPTGMQQAEVTVQTSDASFPTASFKVQANVRDEQAAARPPA